MCQFLTRAPNKVALATSLLIVMTSFLHASTQADIKFTVTPGDPIVTLSLNEVDITFHCLVTSSTELNSLIDPGWTVKFPFIDRNLSTQESIDYGLLKNDSGVTWNRSRDAMNASTSVTIPVTSRKNCTLIWCAAQSSDFTTRKFSEPVKLAIAGPPLPPAPVLTIPCPSQIEIRWDTPFSHANFPVNSYSILIINTTSEEELVQAATVDNSYVYGLNGTDQVTSCHLLNITVTAVNSVGESVPGTVFGGFPIAPSPFTSDIRVDVTFLRDGTPMVDISFEAPFICNYQTSSYTIEIDDTTNPGPPVVTRRNTYTGSSRIIEEMIEGELAMNSNFTVTVTVSDENFDGNITATTKFNTKFSPPVMELEPSGDRGDIWTYIGAAAGVLVAILLAAVLIATVFFCTRKKKKQHSKAPGSAMDNRLNNTRPDQLDNDLFIVPQRQAVATDNGAAALALYETIKDYQEESRNTALSRQHQDYRKLQQLDLQRSEKDELEDSTYQVMNSASQDVTGSYGLQPYPGRPSRLPSNNNDNPGMAAPSQGPGSNVPDNNFPYGYHFRPCPPSSAAALLASPVRVNYRDDPNFQYYTVTPTFGETSVPPIEPDEEEEGEGEGEREGEGGRGGVREDGARGGAGRMREEDYTFMSQAGTLAGLNTERKDSHGQSERILFGVAGFDKNKQVSEC